MTGRSGIAAAAIAALAVAGVAEAKSIRFGSDLKAPANTAETHPVDAVFWAKKLANGQGVTVPKKGRIATVKLKGTAIKHGSKKPVTLFHFQVLRPTTKGRVQVMLTSGPFHVPVGGNPNRVSTYHPVNLCARKGDHIAFSDVGGFQPPNYPHGTPFQVFSSVPGSITNFFSKSGRDNNGDRFKGKPNVGEELLMRMILVTGKAAGICG